MRELKHTIWNVIMWVLVYFALIQNVAGAYNLMTFFIWVLFFRGCAISTETRQEILIKPRSRLSKVFNYTDLIVGSVLVWFGHWFLGVLVILTMFLISSGWDKIEKTIKDNENGCDPES
jgi:hypothetical protein